MNRKTTNETSRNSQEPDLGETVEITTGGPTVRHGGSLTLPVVRAVVSRISGGSRHGMFYYWDSQHHVNASHYCVGHVDVKVVHLEHYAMT